MHQRQSPEKEKEKDPLSETNLMNFMSALAKSGNKQISYPTDPSEMRMSSYKKPTVMTDSVPLSPMSIHETSFQGGSEESPLYRKV